MSARDKILSRVREACGRTEEPLQNSDSKRAALIAALPDDIQQRLNKPKPLTQPAVSTDLIDSMVKQMEAVQMSVVRLQSNEDVVAAVEWYLQEEGINGEVSVAPALKQFSWPQNMRFGAATGTELASVTGAMAAVAETGSIALLSGAQTPATLNFLPETHIVVLYESQVVKHMEDVWSQLREQSMLPRSLNLVTGPSRTGDIEQTIELGAHGPRRLHVLLVAGEQA